VRRGGLSRGIIASSDPLRINDVAVAAAVPAALLQLWSDAADSLRVDQSCWAAALASSCSASSAFGPSLCDRADTGRRRRSPNSTQWRRPVHATQG
jgi:hypothetical protein